MNGIYTEIGVQRTLREALYTECMVLADDARGYFEGIGHSERVVLPPPARVILSCESLKITTRLLHVVAWLLTQRQAVAGNISLTDILDPSRRVGTAPVTDKLSLCALPESARKLVEASIGIHRRALALELTLIALIFGENPALMLQKQILHSFS